MELGEKSPDGKIERFLGMLASRTPLSFLRISTERLIQSLLGLSQIGDATLYGTYLSNKGKLAGFAELSSRP